MILFVRVVVTMVINLYAVRVVVKALGVEDYGILNAIAGVVLTSTFLSSTLTVAIQRFYSYAIGKHEERRMREIFSSSVNIVLLLSVLVLVLFETIGVWFVTTHMMEPAGKIPLERLDATLWIFHFTLLSFVFTLLQIPYTAAIFAHEDMKHYTVISILDYTGRLIVACLIGKALADGLIFYGAGLLVVAALVYLLYVIVARSRYAECHYQRVTTKELYRDLLSFSGWTMYGAMAGVGIVQGTNILLTIFYGPLAVASYAIANLVYNSANSLCNCVVLAFRPAMVKSYAQRQDNYLWRLFNANNKLIMYLLMSVAVPLMAEMRTLLHWWLGDISEDAILFARLMMIMMVVLAMHHPITTLIESTGRVKRYHVVVDTLTLSTLFITWTMFRLGMPAYGAFVSMIFVCIMAHVVRLISLKKVYPAFSYATYAKTVVLPGLFITVCTAAVALLLHYSIANTVLRFIAVMVASPLVTLQLVWLAGLNGNERTMFGQFIRNYNHKQ